jgi:nicotinamide-nucleotide amidase
VVGEIVTIGNEILSGRTVDTNFAVLARELEASGIPIVYHQSVGDRVDHIVAALKQAAGRADLVLVTGGLGPTPDDLTRKGIAQAFGRPLGLDEQVLESIRRRWREQGGSDPMPALNELQAMVPRGARVLENPVGSAPGLLVEHKGKAIFVLPGVPGEMRALLSGSVLPWLAARRREPVAYHVFRTTGMRESVLAGRIGDLVRGFCEAGFAFLPHLGGVDVRIRLPEGDPARREGLREEVRRRLAERLGPYLYAEGDRELEEVVGELLLARGYLVAVAESCTGGLLAGRFTDTPGSSRYFERGVVCYSNRSKEELLGVPHDLIERHGAVSEPVARAMARAVAEKSGVAAGIGITGIAGPDGGTPEKPVGTVHVAAVAGPAERHRRLALRGDRQAIRERSVVAALDLLRRLLLGVPEA